MRVLRGDGQVVGPCPQLADIHVLPGLFLVREQRDMPEISVSATQTLSELPSTDATEERVVVPEDPVSPLDSWNPHVAPHYHDHPGIASAGLLLAVSRQGCSAESVSSRTHAKSIRRASVWLPTRKLPPSVTT